MEFGRYWYRHPVGLVGALVRLFLGGWLAWWLIQSVLGPFALVLLVCLGLAGVGLLIVAAVRERREAESTMSVEDAQELLDRERP